MTRTPRFVTIQALGLLAAALTVTAQQPPTTSGCFTDTSVVDFSTSDVAPINCDFTSVPGSVRLTSPIVIDQENTSVTTNGLGFEDAAWVGQSFTAATTGALVKVDMMLFCAGCGPPNTAVAVSIRAATAGGIPIGADLAQSTIAGFDSNVSTLYSASFAAPADITAGSKYAVILRSSRPVGIYAAPCSCGPDSDPYSGGFLVTSANSGATWAPFGGGRDIGFKVHVNTGYSPTGTFTSSRKDSAPGLGGTVTWGNITWNATVPAGTTLQFQVAASQFAAGPFNFVGPDGTASTYFSNGASLAQFNGKRFLRYRAHMTSTGADTPIIDAVSICFSRTPQPMVDLDGDDTSDVFTYGAATGAWKRAIAQGDGTFAEVNGSWDPNWTVLPAKFNQDNLTDMFLFNTTSGQWFRMLNDGASGFTTQATGDWWNGWQRFVMDVDGDGISDIFLYDPASGVWFKAVLSNPAGDFTYMQGGWNPGWEITPMILNDDALGDMFLIDRTTGRWFWVLGQPGADFLYTATDVWFPGWNFYPGDYTGDGNGDLLLHDPATGTYFVAINNGLGIGFNYTSGGWSLGWTPIAADLDADGDQDLFLHDPATGVWFQMLSDGAGGFSAAGNQTWSLGWNIYPADFNGDRRSDFLLYHPTTGVWYQALNLSLGTFTYSSGAWAPNLTIIARAPFF